MRSWWLVLLLGGVLSAEDVLPAYKNVKEGEVFVVSDATKMSGTTSTEMVLEFRVDKIDMEAKTLTYTRTATTKLPGMDPIKQTADPETISMTAPPAVGVTPPDPAPKPDALKPDSVEITVKGLDGKDVTLKCTHNKTEVDGVTTELWSSVDRLDADVKCGDGARKVHAHYAKFVSDVPGAGGVPPIRSVQETWTATDDLPMFAAVLASHTTVEGGPTPVDTTARLVEIRMR